MKHLREASGPPLTEIPAPSWIFDRIEEWAGRFPRRFAFAIDRQDHVDEYTYTDVLKQADAFRESSPRSASNPETASAF